MKRDCDLVRQVLLCIEHRGATCPLEALRADLRHESDERLRYHLQLVIDARWVAEVERSVAGPLGVRLTHDGHEFVEVARGDVRWRAAKAVVIEQTGGLSLALVRVLLLKWARRMVVGSRRVGRLRRPRQIRRFVECAAPAWWEGAFVARPDSTYDDDQVRILHRHRGNRKRRRTRVGFDAGLGAGRDAGYGTSYGANLHGGLAEELANEREERRPTVTLPPHMI
jgi:hypothetical protein